MAQLLPSFPPVNLIHHRARDMRDPKTWSKKMNLKLYTPHSTHLAPLSGFQTLNNRLGRLFEDVPTPGLSNWPPPVCVEETADSILLTAETPGLTLENLTVELENNILTISGEKSEAREENVEDRRLHLSERRYGSFRRSFALPRTVDAENIDARLEHGILTVSLPKAAEAKSRTIQVKS
jgi:HSP20 family protein